MRTWKKTAEHEILGCAEKETDCSTHLPAGVAELDAALADVDGDNFTRPARVAFVARSFFCSTKKER